MTSRKQHLPTQNKGGRPKKRHKPPPFHDALQDVLDKYKERRPYKKWSQRKPNTTTVRNTLSTFETLMDIESGNDRVSFLKYGFGL